MRNAQASVSERAERAKRAAGECFHSFFEFSQTFTSVQLDYSLSISMRDSWLGCALVNYYAIEIESE